MSQAGTPPMGEVRTIIGPLRAVWIPTGLGYDDPLKVGKALLRDRFDLSREELRTLILLIKGLTYERIGDRLGIHDDTVKNRIRSIFKKMCVSDRNQAAAKACVFVAGSLIADDGEGNDENS